MKSLAFLALGLICSCSGNLSSSRLEHQEDYLISAPIQRHYTYERKLDGDSWIRGTLTVDIEEVSMPADATATYEMKGSFVSTMEGRYATRLAAQEAPRAAVQAAMNPANIPEVFEDIESRPGVLVSQLHWDRLDELRLPIVVEEEFRSASPFSSALMDGSWNTSVELAMVWHKPLMFFLSLPPFGTFHVTSIDEDADGVTLELRHDFGGKVPYRYEYSFARDGRSLTRLIVHHLDGTTTVVEEAGAGPTPR